MVVLDQSKVHEDNGFGVSSAGALQKPSPFLAFTAGHGGGVTNPTAAGGDGISSALTGPNSLTATTGFVQSPSPYIQPLASDLEVRTIMWSIIFN